jgi:hypothetical protein
MENQYPVKRPLLKNKLLRFLAIELCALLISLCAVIGIGIIAVEFAAYYFRTEFLWQDDTNMVFGIGVIAAFFGSFIISLPISVFIHVYFIKKYFLRG